MTPSRAARRCSIPYCPNPAERGGSRCREHRATHDRERKGRGIYTTARWRKLRARVLRDEPNCRLCGQPATHVDHIIDWRKGGPTWDVHNLQPLCASCHGRKTRAEAAGARPPRTGPTAASLGGIADTTAALEHDPERP